MIPIIYILLNVIHAWYHSYLIKKDEVIYSNQKTIEYSVASILTATVLIFFHYPVLPMILFALLSRMAFFDILLNLLRGKSWLYEGEISKKKSIIDLVENKTGLPIWFLRLFYIACYIGYLIIYLV